MLSRAITGRLDTLFAQSNSALRCIYGRHDIFSAAKKKKAPSW